MDIYKLKFTQDWRYKNTKFYYSKIDYLTQINVNYVQHIKSYGFFIINQQRIIIDMDFIDTNILKDERREYIFKLLRNKLVIEKRNSSINNILYE